MEISVKNNIDAFVSKLGEFRDEVIRQAVPAALNRAAETVATQAVRLVAVRSNIPRKKIAQAVRVTRASSSNFTAKVRVSRAAVPLSQFSARQVRSGVRVRVGTEAKVIKGAFLAKMPSGHIGVFVREPGAKHKRVKAAGKTRWSALPIRELFGPSVGGVVANADVQKLLSMIAIAVFEKRLAHEMKRAAQKANVAEAFYAKSLRAAVY